MKSLLGKLLLMIVCANCVATAKGAEYFIAPGGNNSNGGTLGSPWGTFDFAIDQLNAGDTLFVRGGTYNLASRIRLSTGDGGALNNPVNIWAYESSGIMETPILDFAGMPTSLWGQSSGRGIQIDEGINWVHVKGLTIQNARDNGLYAGSNNNTLERITARWNGDSGVQLHDSASFNLILNSDSYENYDPYTTSGGDPRPGENADGFAVKFSEIGPGNVIRGSRAWGNSDDGWDMWQSTLNGVLVEDSWAFDNGKDIWNVGEDFAGDGNGFKLGETGGPHQLNRVLAWENAVRGIDSNRNGNGVMIKNSTVYNSGRNWDFDEFEVDVTNEHLLYNNISFAGSSPDLFFDSVTHSHNSWNGGVTLTADDFLSLDDTIARGPRNPDGSLPISNFLRLASNSDLIDAGIDVGLPFHGLAPDLGAFETTPVVIFAAADFDEDGDVDGDDLGDWQTGYGTMSGAAHGDGDADEDGDVDGADFLAWQRGYAPAPAAASASVAVPEPTTIALFILTALAIGGRRQRVS
jgi:hypothetical protein